MQRGGGRGERVPTWAVRQCTVVAVVTPLTARAGRLAAVVRLCEGIRVHLKREERAVQRKRALLRDAGLRDAWLPGAGLRVLGFGGAQMSTRCGRR